MIMRKKRHKLHAGCNNVPCYLLHRSCLAKNGTGQDNLGVCLHR
jgi:hypothetical protein